MDIFDRVKQDHDEFRDLFEQATKAAENDVAKSKELFEKIKKELTAHHEAEEHTFFAGLAQKPETKDITEEAYEEHKAIELYLKEVEQNQDVRWAAKLKVLKETTEHHLKEEEDSMFPKGREVLLESELQGAVEQFEARKKEQLAKAG